MISLNIKEIVLSFEVDLLGVVVVRLPCLKKFVRKFFTEEWITDIRENMRPTMVQKTTVMCILLAGKVVFCHLCAAVQSEQDPDVTNATLPFSSLGIFMSC